MKKKFLTALTFGICLLNFTGCSGTQEDQMMTGAVNVPGSEKLMIQTDAGTGDEIPLGQIQTIVSSYLPEYSMDEMIQKSTLVVRGTVRERSEPFVICGVGDLGEMTFCDNIIDVEELLRGEIENDQVTVRMKGHPDDSRRIYEENPSLELGQEYIFFLERQTEGGGFNTPGDYYYIIAMNQGVLEEIELSQSDIGEMKSRSFSAEETGESLFVAQSLLSEVENNVISEEDMVDFEELEAEGGVLDHVAEPESLFKRIEEIEEIQPSDETLSTRTYKENLATNLETGFLSQEEYDQLIAALEEYAQIVE